MCHEATKPVTTITEAHVPSLCSATRAWPPLTTTRERPRTATETQHSQINKFKKRPQNSGHRDEDVARAVPAKQEGGKEGRREREPSKPGRKGSLT